MGEIELPWLYPENAEIEYLQALNDAIELWFSDFKTQLEQAPQKSNGPAYEAVFVLALLAWRDISSQINIQLPKIAGIVSRTVDEAFSRQLETVGTSAAPVAKLAPTTPSVGSVQGEVEKFARANSLLVKDIGEKAARDLERIIEDAVSKNKTAEDIADLVADTLEVTKSRAALIARDQIGTLQSQINRVKMQNAGIEKYKWVAVMDKRTRPEHEQLHGTIRTWDQSPRPGEPINCRCVPVPHFES